MMIAAGIVAGALIWLLIAAIFGGIYTVDQNQRAVKTSFGRAERLSEDATTLDLPELVETLRPEERERYSYPQVRVIQPGGPYFKLPWERVYKVNVATQTVSMALDPETPQANEHGTRLDAVTKDQLNTGLMGQLRFHISETNLYAYIFGIKKPFVHAMGYFVCVLRQKIANFEAKPGASLSEAPVVPAGSEMIGISINDLRKNLRDLNEYMDYECRATAARYGVVLDASLITSIDPPPEVESALAAINTAHNQVSSDISLAQAAADQKIVQSKRALEIETLKAQAEVQPIRLLADELAQLHRAGSNVLQAYVRNVKLKIFEKTKTAYVEVSR